MVGCEIPWQSDLALGSGFTSECFPPTSIPAHLCLAKQKTFVCSTNAVNGGYCSSDNLGSFILDLPSEKSISDTSFWSARVSFDEGQGGSLGGTLSSKGLWDNPA